VTPILEIKFTCLAQGGQVSSTNDLNLFAQAMSNNELLSATTYTLMRQTHSILDGVKYGYGTGGPMYLGHGGSLDGFQTLMEIDILRKIGILILTNGGCATRVTLDQIRRLIWQFYGYKLSEL